MFAKHKYACFWPGCERSYDRASRLHNHFQSHFPPTNPGNARSNLRAISRSRSPYRPRRGNKHGSNMRKRHFIQLARGGVIAGGRSNMNADDVVDLRSPSLSPDSPSILSLTPERQLHPHLQTHQDPAGSQVRLRSSTSPVTNRPNSAPSFHIHKTHQAHPTSPATSAKRRAIARLSLSSDTPSPGPGYPNGPIQIDNSISTQPFKAGPRWVFETPPPRAHPPLHTLPAMSSATTPSSVDIEVGAMEGPESDRQHGNHQTSLSDADDEDDSMSCGETEICSAITSKAIQDKNGHIDELDSTGEEDVVRPCDWKAPASPFPLSGIPNHSIGAARPISTPTREKNQGIALDIQNPSPVLIGVDLQRSNIEDDPVGAQLIQTASNLPRTPSGSLRITENEEMEDDISPFSSLSRIAPRPVAPFRTTSALLSLPTPTTPCPKSIRCGPVGTGGEEGDVEMNTNDLDRFLDGAKKTLAGDEGWSRDPKLVERGEKNDGPHTQRLTSSGAPDRYSASVTHYTSSPAASTIRTRPENTASLSKCTSNSTMVDSPTNCKDSHDAILIALAEHILSCPSIHSATKSRS
ncbi:hypothetical protein IAR55_000102 [Kwoniella newhampshirensis]|uniref:C2H2-type domain-containing protein n=1 Tax=Kwoniella newhampshirensis TaxID=1651941 RepID=A0AAW0Z640_9TREE